VTCVFSRRELSLHFQAPPNLSYGDFPRLLGAGINDWGGVSPLTKDFINPEAAWPEIERPRNETRIRRFALRERLALYPEFVQREGFVAPKVRQRMDCLMDAEGYSAR
jgi:FO synthase